ncbi:ras-related protein Rab-23-like [Maniola jurtina]|nr:ras-related protein Rab-23-like [Maniola jurtina]
MDQCVVGPDEAELVARALGCRLMRASVKEDVNVGAVFRALAARCLADMRREHSTDSPPPCVAPVIGTFTNHNSNGTILLRPTKHRSGGKKKNVLKSACRIL